MTSINSNRYCVVGEKNVKGKTWIGDSLNLDIRQEVFKREDAQYIVDFLNQDVITWETAVQLCQGRPFGHPTSAVNPNHLVDFLLERITALEERELIALTAIENLITKVTDLEKLAYKSTPTNHSTIKDVLLRNAEAKADLLRGFKCR